MGERNEVDTALSRAAVVLLCYKLTNCCRIVFVGKDRAPGPQQRRFAAYIEGLAEAAGHADRQVPLKNYCTGLLLPGERKSIEPITARLAPDNVRRMQSVAAPRCRRCPLERRSSVGPMSGFGTTSDAKARTSSRLGGG